MKKLLLALLTSALSFTGWANTYIHYSGDKNTEWCQIYDEEGKWIGAFKTEWKNDTDIIGNVTLYNWSEKWSSILQSTETKEDKHIYLTKPPKNTETLDLALNS